MSTLTLRLVKGSPLTWAELDANLTNLNNDKLEKSGGTMTGALGIAVGADATPGLFVVGDTNTGIRGDGLDTLRLITAGVLRQEILANGNVAFDTNTLFVDAVNNLVGFGTTGIADSNVPLQLNAAVGQQRSIGLNNEGTYGILLTVDNAGAKARLRVVPATWPLTFETNIGEVARMTAGGNVGIGSTNPLAKLWINNGTNRNLGITTDATQAGTSGIAVGSFNDASAGYMPLSLLGSFITMNSNVLIGSTTDSGSKLHVEDGRLRVKTNAASSATIDIDWDGTTRRIHAFEEGGGNARPLKVLSQEFTVADDSQSRLKVDGSSTAGQTALLVWDVDNGALERVTVGAADSGGAGFKVLRLPN